MKIYITNISWDLSEYPGKTASDMRLPSSDSFEVDGAQEDYSEADVRDFIEDYLSDVYPLCVESYSYETSG